MIERQIIDCDEQCITEPGTHALSREEPKLKNGMKERAEDDDFDPLIAEVNSENKKP